MMCVRNDYTFKSGSFMSKRIVFAAVMAAFIAANLNASGPFDWFSNNRKGSSAKLSKLRRILNSPEKMTELYGPSILVRVAKIDQPKQSKFVTQPD